VHLSPTYTLIETDRDLVAIEREIAKVKPVSEITLEGLTEIAKARIIEWHPSRHFFAVEWQKKPESFGHTIESRSNLRAFFKAHLFSTQLVFKSMAVRRINENVYHFRIPEQIYKQQRRGALRVPTTNASLIAPQGEFEILDLSVGGARLKRVPGSRVRIGSSLLDCELKLGRKKIANENFGVKITSETETGFGCRFSGLEAADQVAIKQFLMEALRTYYKTEL
jgi:hypothetical protein